MNSMQELLGNMFRDRQLSEDEYVNKQDGLVYCRICHTPRQTAIRAGDGSIVFCPPVLCDCKQAERDVEDAMREAKRKAEEIKSLKRAGFRDRRLLEYTFANDKGYNPEIAMAKRYVELFPDMEARGMGLLLWGNVGTGKTFIAACIANALMEQRIPVYMTNFSRIMNHMMGMVGPDRNAYLDELNRYRLLVIDDLGVEHDSSFAVEQVFSVIDSRCQSGKPMLITTNLSIDQLRSPRDIAHARIFDRVLAHCCPVRINNTQIRQRDAERNIAEAKRLLDGVAK